MTRRWMRVMAWRAKNARARWTNPIAVRAFSSGRASGVGQAGAAVDGGVQVGVAGPLTAGLDAGDLPVLVAALAVDAPSAAVGDLVGLFHIEVDHVTGPAGDDAPGPGWWGRGTGAG